MQDFANKLVRKATVLENPIKPRKLKDARHSSLITSQREESE